MVEGTAARADTVLYGAAWPCNDSPAQPVPAAPRPGAWLPQPACGLKRHSSQLWQGLGARITHPTSPLSPAWPPAQLPVAEDRLGATWEPAGVRQQSCLFQPALIPRQRPAPSGSQF